MKWLALVTILFITSAYANIVVCTTSTNASTGQTTTLCTGGSDNGQDND